MSRFIDSQDSTIDQAAAWVARLRAPDVSSVDRGQFAEWLACSKSHGEAFDQMLDLWQDLGAAGVMPLQIPDIGSRASASNAWSWRGLAATTATLIIAVLAVLYQGPDPVSVDIYRTAIGGQARHQLADGSQLDLNTNTELEVRLSTSRRQINITRGEAYFTVASDRTRPFTTACGPTTAIAVGTAFNVRCEDDRTEVTVTDGVVRVAVTGEAPGMLVHAGEHLVFSHDSATGLFGLSEQDRHLAWLENSLVFNEAPLVEVLAELQRYTMTRIRLTGNDIASLRVSGRFNVRDPELVVRALTKILPIEARQQPGGQILIMPARG